MEAKKLAEGTALGLANERRKVAKAAAAQASPPLAKGLGASGAQTRPRCDKVRCMVAGRQGGAMP